MGVNRIGKLQTSPHSIAEGVAISPFIQFFVIGGQGGGAIFRQRGEGHASSPFAASASQRAVRSRRASSPLGPTSCTPMGMPSEP